MAYEKEVQDFTAQGTDLPESKLESGFLAGERPPANWFNSLFYRMAQAIKELQTKSAEKENFIAKDNATEYTPNADYNPATKKYVDDNKTVVDSELSDTSTNPVQNKVIKEALSNVSITLDSQLSTTSTNGVQNKVITEAINGRAKTVTFEAEIPVSGWSTVAPYYVDVAVAGLLATDRPLITPKYTDTLSTDQAVKEAWSVIDRAVANADSLRVYAFEEVPTTAVPIQIQVVR